jgi:hypothetical protein
MTRRIAEDVICYLIAAHILCWTAAAVFDRLIVEACK